MIRISQLKLGIEESIDTLPIMVAKKLKLKVSDLLEFRIYKESIDARRGSVSFVYTVDVEIKNSSEILNRNLPNVSLTPDLQYKMPEIKSESPVNKPIVIGFGPAGMFASLLLAQCGYQPIVLERGSAVDERVESIEEFWKHGILNKESNIQFGEGGAGTFSDGKLTTRVKDLRGRKVLEELVRAGAPEEILYMAHPHVGTDLLRGIVKNIRNQIINLGGKVFFNTKVSDFIIEENVISGVKTETGDTFYSNNVILAIGHSARDTFNSLYNHKIDLVPKPFAVGARIEHPQSLINKAQFKEFANHEKLGSAEYRLTHQASNGRGVYTFCMCPGGFVVPSSSEPEMVVTNGMSEHARNQTNANSGLLVQIQVEDFESDHPLAGVEFQRNLESKAFQMGGRNYQAPAQLVKDFLANVASTKIGNVTPSYSIGVKLCNLHDLLPKVVCEAMVEALQAFDKKLNGFALDDAVLTAVETRSSSPVRITRTSDTLQSTNISGLYPCGEGAGFAGGIVSSAIDGLKCAESLITNFV